MSFIVGTEGDCGIHDRDVGVCGVYGAVFCVKRGLCGRDAHDDDRDILFIASKGIAGVVTRELIPGDRGVYCSDERYGRPIGPGDEGMWGFVLSFRVI